MKCPTIILKTNNGTAKEKKKDLYNATKDN